MRARFRPLSSPGARIQVFLDGKPVPLPPLRHSLAAIRSYLERLALAQQRILCAFCVDGQCLQGDEVVFEKPVARVDAQSMDLAQVPLQILDTARQQTVQARDRVAAAVTTTLINSSRQAREHWWNLTRELKQPLLTLSLMPFNICVPANGSASLLQLRKWQLQQLAAILKDVDETCWSADPLALSDALERRVLPWLDGLGATLELWYETLLAAGPASSDHGDVK